MIFWGDETGLRADDVRGRSYAPPGKTPVVRPNHRRIGLGLISEVSNRGELRWKVLDGAIKAPVLLVHGDMDWTVRVAESDKMDAALASTGHEVNFLRFKGLDHQLDDSDARIEMLTQRRRGRDELERRSRRVHTVARAIQERVRRIARFVRLGVADARQQLAAVRIEHHSRRPARRLLCVGRYDLGGVKLQVTAHKFSASAKEKIEAAGGTTQLVGGETE